MELSEVLMYCRLKTISKSSLHIYRILFYYCHVIESVWNYLESKSKNVDTWRHSLSWALTAWVLCALDTHWTIAVSA
jgi:hypothetical protein